MSSYEYSMADVPTSAQYLYSGNNALVHNSGSYASLAKYNNMNMNPLFTGAPPIPTMSETTVVQIVPSFGGVGFSSPQISKDNNYATLKDAYCCGQNSCQSVTQPLSANIVKNIYGKR